MTAAAASAIAIFNTGLTIALVRSAVKHAAVLVDWQLVGNLVAKKIISSSVMVRILSVVDLVSEGSGAEAAFDQGLALSRAILGKLSATVTSTIAVSFAFHSLATVLRTIG